jgi:4-hydroxy-4-methyl-2-oxoglutarate aldolase
VRQAVSLDVLEQLKRYDSCTLSNAIEVFDVRPRDVGFAAGRIRCLFPSLAPMVGFAATATVRARGKAESGNQDVLFKHTQDVPAPRVLVVQDLDDDPGAGALIGEVMGNIFKRLGCEGIVTDGGVRDLKEVEAIGFQYFAPGPVVSHAYIRVEQAGVPVVVAGLRVEPGDLIFGDRHGVLLVPQEIAAELPAAADKIVEREQKLIAWVRSDEFSLDRLAEMRQVKH